jgi:DNA-binding beta-propeller fold protein YncE
MPKTNDRIVKYSKDGKLIKAWGRHGSGQGEFDEPHGLAMDSAGRLFVADRANNRIQIFDQDGKFLAEWKQFGRIHADQARRYIGEPRFHLATFSFDCESVT